MGPEFVDQKTKERISLKHKGMCKPWVAENLKGKKRSLESIEKGKIKTTGQKRTPQTKNKMSQDRKGISKPEGFGDKVSKSLMGYKRTEQNRINISKGLTGIIRSEGTRLKMSQSKKGKRAKSIEQYDLQNNKIREFKSITEACDYLGKYNRQGDITACCKGKQKTAFGYIWKYKNN